MCCVVDDFMASRSVENICPLCKEKKSNDVSLRVHLMSVHKTDDAEQVLRVYQGIPVLVPVLDSKSINITDQELTERKAVPFVSPAKRQNNERGMPAIRVSEPKKKPYLGNSEKGVTKGKGESTIRISTIQKKSLPETKKLCTDNPPVRKARIAHVATYKLGGKDDSTTKNSFTGRKNSTLEFSLIKTNELVKVSDVVKTPTGSENTVLSVSAPLEEPCKEKRVEKKSVEKSTIKSNKSVLQQLLEEKAEVDAVVLGVTVVKEGEAQRQEMTKSPKNSKLSRTVKLMNQEKNEGKIISFKTGNECETPRNNKGSLSERDEGIKPTISKRPASDEGATSMAKKQMKALPLKVSIKKIDRGIPPNKSAEEGDEMIVIDEELEDPLKKYEADKEKNWKIRPGALFQNEDLVRRLWKLKKSSSSNRKQLGKTIRKNK